MEFTKGNLLSADTEATVNTVNSAGFMGHGIAAQFNPAYPQAVRGGPLGHLERVAKQFEGFETSFGMELLAEVHWLRAHEDVRHKGMVEAVHGWNTRKRTLADEQARLAAKRQGGEGWLAQV